MVVFISAKSRTYIDAHTCTCVHRYTPAIRTHTRTRVQFGAQEMRVQRDDTANLVTLREVVLDPVTYAFSNVNADDKLWVKANMCNSACVCVFEHVRVYVQFCMFACLCICCC